MTAPKSSFLVNYYYKNELILSLNVEYFNEYVAALKASDYVKVNESTYKIKEIIMQHIKKDGITIQLIINLG